MRFLEPIVEGGYLPRWRYRRLSWPYGVAWRNWETRGAVCAPVPFNQIIYQVVRLWHWLRMAHGGDAIMALWDRAYSLGAELRQQALESTRRDAYSDGYRAGMTEGRREATAEIENAVMTQLLARAHGPEQQA